MNNENKAPVLTLEHLAPYLPYGVEVKTEDGIFKVVGWVDDIGICLDTIFYGANAIPEYKLILRPLSDLTKEIEHHGKRFIPLHIINGFGKNSESICDRWIEPNLTTQGGGSWEGGIEDDIDTFQFYWLYVKLLSWHFDVFGLIEKGLAIEINSIEGKEIKS